MRIARNTFIAIYFVFNFGGVAHTGEHQPIKSTVASCHKEAHLMQKEIDAINPSLRIHVFNESGSHVGWFIKKHPARYDVHELFLCGINEGYYDVDGNIRDWISKPGETKSIGQIYADNYDVVATAQTLKKQLKINLDIRAVREITPEWTRYSPLITSVFVDLPSGDSTYFSGGTGGLSPMEPEDECPTLGSRTFRSGCNWLD